MISKLYSFVFLLEEVSSSLAITEMSQLLSQCGVFEAKRKDSATFAGNS